MGAAYVATSLIGSRVRNRYDDYWTPWAPEEGDTGLRKVHEAEVVALWVTDHNACYVALRTDDGLLFTRPLDFVKTPARARREDAELRAELRETRERVVGWLWRHKGDGRTVRIESVGFDEKTLRPSITYVHTEELAMDEPILWTRDAHVFLERFERELGMAVSRLPDSPPPPRS